MYIVFLREVLVSFYHRNRILMYDFMVTNKLKEDMKTNQ